MEIEKLSNQLNSITSFEFYDINPRDQQVATNGLSETNQIGKYQITEIVDWGDALIVYLDNIADVNGKDAIKIYVDKDLFRSQFQKGSYVTRMRIAPKEIKVIDLPSPIDGVLNTEDYFINDETQKKSQRFYPWDPYW